MREYTRHPNVRSQLIRAIVQTVNDAGPQQLVALTGLTGQAISQAVRSQHFGLTSNPPAGGEGLILALGGGLDRGHVLGLEHPQYRPTGLGSGATQLYDMGGNYLLLNNTIAMLFHKSSGNYTKIDSNGNVSTHIASTSQQHYLGGDPSLGGTFAPVSTTSGPSPYAQARVS